MSKRADPAPLMLPDDDGAAEDDALLALGIPPAPPPLHRGSTEADMRAHAAATCARLAAIEAAFARGDLRAATDAEVLEAFGAHPDRPH
jgi:hypothetical protein